MKGVDMSDDTGWWLDEYDGPKFWRNVNKLSLIHI